MFSLFLDIAERRFESAATSCIITSEGGSDRAIRSLQGLTAYRFDPDRELKPFTETGCQRILRLNTVHERLCV